MKILKKLFALSILAALPFAIPSANAQIYQKGSMDLNFQLGFGSNYYYSGNIVGGVPLITIGGDMGLVDEWGPGVFGVGGVVGFSTYKSESFWFDDPYGYKYTRIVIAPRATYHYQFVDKLDTYAGVVSGLSIAAQSTYGDWPGDEPSTSGDVDPVFSAFAGAKYYLTESFAVMSEIYVYDLAVFNIGVSLKLK